MQKLGWHAFWVIKILVIFYKKSTAYGILVKSICRRTHSVAPRISNEAPYMN